MDELDVRILRELVQGQTIAPLDPNFRKSFGAIARTLSVDRDTVRNRIRRLHTTGFIRGWHTFVNPRLFGGGMLAIWFDVDPAVKDDLVEKFRLLPGTMIIDRFYGTFLALVLRYYDEWSGRKHIDLVRELADVDRLSVMRVPLPECHTTVSRTDWAILRSLATNPRKHLTTIAKDVNLSSRTVRRKLERLTRGAVLFALPVLDPKAVQGGMIANLVVTYGAKHEQDLDQRIATTLDRHLWHVFKLMPFEPDDTGCCSFDLAIQNAARAHEIHQWARGLPGVLEARVELFEDIDTLSGIFDAEIEDRIDKLLAAARTPHPTARA